ncbi:30S ribosomal protein S21, chloroplastic [Prosopis cineraria]|uniref:30S ribosomal protein S21, chloroplastic n=1 Tax=Prosopis cineraria TaxID=364024 RepID=UPI00240FAAFE|nr:30S ribosomal protein S21, chloroplastic [Prosopis cineraria]
MTPTNAAMAASSSFSNFLSFILPSKPPAPKTPPPSQFNPSSSSSSSSSALRFPSLTGHNSPDSFAPLVSEDDGKHNSCLSAELSSVICPSLAYSNTLFFRSAYNVQVIVAENESEERLLNRFRREVMRTGLIQECKRRRFFESKQDEKKRKSREAAKRNRRRPRQSRFSTESKPEVPTTTKKEEDDDNWDMPEEDTPY